MSRPSLEKIGNLSVFSGDGESSSPARHPSSHNSGDIHSSSELVIRVNDAEHPTSPASYPDFDISPESPEFDENFRPSNEEIKASETINHAVLAGANDQFWQSFLTEESSSSVLSRPEHQSEKRSTTGGRTSETMPNSDGRFWWNANSIDSLAKNMGRIGTAKRT
uniref:Uncharacterized protein n=1 Tax=Rhizophora mucronata TaxID=61149 RepID=A0A2P2JFJ9_RHIMU